ncbi:hypothetical protein MIND_00215500 [Mycena indigotica]|uniref:Uncharacterized protein n=1 Tax=Mycena indigotica TaxID=2126181 RepID=A0A8H6T761_9AGAR|nr:uncharacterized protein MIND_00215500 [Mycena indigotica]KAF7312034.1 hypothetical protein MIND_00215500 [Mycena indigotica]
MLSPPSSRGSSPSPSLFLGSDYSYNPRGSFSSIASSADTPLSTPRPLHAPPLVAKAHSWEGAQLTRRRPGKLVKAKRSFHKPEGGNASLVRRKYSVPSVIVTKTDDSEQKDQTRFLHPGVLTTQTYIFVLGLNPDGSEQHGPPTELVMWTCCGEEECAIGCALLIC